jgi:proteasome lid subunit RPN8/RPN11
MPSTSAPEHHCRPRGWGLSLTVFVPARARDQLIREAQKAFPCECCGLLIGRQAGTTKHIDRIIPAANIADGDRTRRYRIDWETLSLLIPGRRPLGPQEQVLGFYHSHPHGPADPSPSDHALAWPDRLYLIVSPWSGKWDLTGWRWSQSAGRLAPVS